MINDKLRQLIELLTKKTKNKEALWNKASGDNQFKLLLPEGIVVTVGVYPGDYNNPESYNVSVYNSNGNVIQRYNTDNDTSEVDFELMKEFHQSASDAYYKVDETFDALLKSVNSQGVIGTLDKEKPEVDDLPF